MEPSFWQAFKNVITDVLPIAHDSLHVLAGLGIHLTMCFLFNKPINWKGALLIVALIESCAEFQDSMDDRRVFGMWIWRESLKDFLLTITPSVALLVFSQMQRIRRVD